MTDVLFQIPVTWGWYGAPLGPRNVGFLEGLLICALGYGSELNTAEGPRQSAALWKFPGHSGRYSRQTTPALKQAGAFKRPFGSSRGSPERLRGPSHNKKIRSFKLATRQLYPIR